MIRASEEEKMRVGGHPFFLWNEVLDMYMEEKQRYENSSLKIETICSMGSFPERKENGRKKPSGKAAK